MSRKLEEYTKEELLAYIAKLKKDTTFGLVWNPKEEQVAVDCETKAPVLAEVPEKTITKAGKDEPTHLLLEGDNYHSLSVLNYTHAGKVDVIYIDPPYNTGNKDFIYNDHYVDKEDPYRHSEWLSFMDNRLRLAKNLLADTGAIFISIDDNEQAHLKILCDTIFGADNFIAQIIWQKKYTQANDAKYFSSTHDFILCYAKRESSFKVSLLPRTAKQDARYKNQDNDPRGPWMTQPLHAKSGKDTSYTYTFRNGVTWKPPASTYPRFSKESLERADKENEIWFGSKGTAVPRLKKYLHEMKEGVIPKTIWMYDEVGSNDDARRELKAILPDNTFDTPKPTTLIERIIMLASEKKDAVVMDFFAGSGTAGHAVLKLNAEDGGKRQFILGTDNENGIAENITYERINKVINGYSSTAGIPANLRYFRTEFVDTNGIATLTDKEKLDITREMGAMIALRENSFDQVEQTDHWQTYENESQLTAIYYREDKTKIDEYLRKLNAQDKPVKLYVFGWGKNAGTEYASKKISVEDIPEPLIEVYKEIAK